MKKIIFIIMILMACSGISNVGAEEKFADKNISELLEIIVSNHDSFTLIDMITSELEKRIPSNEEEIFRLFELLEETEGDIQQIIVDAIFNINDTANAHLIINELESSHLKRVAVACKMSGRLKLKGAVAGLSAVIMRYGEIYEKADTETEQVVVAAVEALAEIRDEQSLAALTGFMGTLSGYDSIALSGFGAQAIETLLNKIKEESLSSAGLSAAWAISMITDPGAVKYLMRIVEQKNHPAGKFAVIALLNIDRENTIRSFLEMWRRNKNAFIESQLLLYINRKHSQEPTFRFFLAHVLKHNPNVYARKGAALALGRIGGAEAAEVLTKAARYDKDFFVRVYAYQALQTVGEFLD